MRLISTALIPALALLVSLPACNDDGGEEMSDETTGDGDGDPGDGDGAPGDGDGAPGDGDGAPGDGDGAPGDGDGAPGDGDGAPGDGDGDGAPGDGDGDGAPGDGDGDGAPGLSFEGDVFPIFMGTCSCHVAGAGNLSMPNAGSAYDNLVGIPAFLAPDLDLVTPGDPDNSFLYQKIAGIHDGISSANAQMPKTPGMAMSANPLSDVNQMTVYDWILDGAAP